MGGKIIEIMCKEVHFARFLIPGHTAVCYLKVTISISYLTVGCICLILPAVANCIATLIASYWFCKVEYYPSRQKPYRRRVCKVNYM